MTAIDIIINDHHRHAPALATDTLAPKKQKPTTLMHQSSIILTISPKMFATQCKLLNGRIKISAKPELTASRGSILSP